jgi:hypothetical protein
MNTDQALDTLRDFLEAACSKHTVDGMDPHSRRLLRDAVEVLKDALYAAKPRRP